MKTPEPPEWTPEEWEAFERLPRESDPPPFLEERLVEALRVQGLLRATRGPARRTSPAWWATGIAAALALFFGGMVAGQWRASTATENLVAALQVVDAAERAALVQRTGSLYVEALTGLAELQARGEDEAVGTGVEVAAGALYAAALELARLHPEDPRFLRILEALGAEEGTQAPGTGNVRQVLWF